MMIIPFSHYYEKMPLGINKPGAKTVLTGYTVVEHLTPEFIEYDTATEEGWNCILPTKGPYLILFLKTTCPRSIHMPSLGESTYRWATVRLPWRRGYQQCRNDKKDAVCNMNCRRPMTADRPMRCIEWQPIVPAKYRQARGKEVKIAIEVKEPNS